MAYNIYELFVYYFALKVAVYGVTNVISLNQIANCVNLM